jgi:carbon storage regulator
MLVLTRKVGEKIIIDNNIVVEVLEVHGQRVRLGLTAPANVPIARQELLRPDATLPVAREPLPAPR